MTIEFISIVYLIFFFSFNLYLSFSKRYNKIKARKAFVKAKGKF